MAMYLAQLRRSSAPLLSAAAIFILTLLALSSLNALFSQNTQAIGLPAQIHRACAPVVRVPWSVRARRSRREGLRVQGKLLIPGEDGVEEDSLFIPFMKPLSKGEREKFGNPAQMLKVLRFQAAPWMEVSPETITEDGGVTCMEQGNWKVALEVYRSLQEEGASMEVLNTFSDSEESAEVMFALRYTPKEIRRAAAEYAVEKNMDSRDAEVLSRNIVDFMRIQERARVGFEYTPADCKALRLYMQACEEQDEKAYKSIVEEARQCGASATALARFDELNEMDLSKRRQQIYKFAHDTEEFDRALTVSSI
ncbi:hypothetical protein AAMO2058_001530400 [Amorphochlora amoebiformis]